MAENSLTTRDERALQQEHADALLKYVFEFTDPVTIGNVLQQCGYSPNTEIALLVQIATDQEAYGASTRMGAIQMLQNLRNKALELSGLLAEVTETRRDSSVEAMRTVKVTQNVTGYLQKENADGQLPGEHKPPRAGLLPAGGDSVSVVRGRPVQEREGAPGPSEPVPKEAEPPKRGPDQGCPSQGRPGEDGGGQHPEQPPGSVPEGPSPERSD